MINPALCNIARDIGYSESTIDYAKELTYNTKHTNYRANERNLFVAALIISAKIKNDYIISTRHITDKYEVSYKNMYSHKNKVLESNGLCWLGQFYAKSHKIPSNIANLA